MNIPPRTSFATTVYKNKLWIIGGQDAVSGRGFNDVWNLSPTSSAWINIKPNTAPSLPRMIETDIGLRRMDHHIIVYGDKLWVV